ncbi:MAG: alpha/beta hydrolase domain-containing protein [Steroidobacteraceae bacterium]
MAGHDSAGGKRARGRHVAALSLALASLLADAVQAEVVRVEIGSRQMLPRAEGAPQFELIEGWYFGELDPAATDNAIITDITLAPRNPQRRVEYAATFALSRPVRAGDDSGVLFYDSPNRGTGRPGVDAAGHMHLVSGWQGDIPAAAGMQSAIVPRAVMPDGRPVTGPVFVRFTNMPVGASHVALRAGLGAGVPLAVPATLDTTQARLTRTPRGGRAQKLSPDDWAFADCSTRPFPGTPDPHSLCVRGGFDPSFAYDLRYTGQGPLVLGIGFAAVRDLVDFLHHDPGSAAAPNPLAGQVRHTVMTGVSQAGNFVRSFIHLGFNLAHGRIVFDGANPHIAARQVPLNVRFGVPGGAAEPFEPGSEGVLWWGQHEDRGRKRGGSSLLARCQLTQSCPKIVETLGSAEFWGLRLSPDFIGVEAAGDIPLPANVRRYYFPSTTHGGGPGGFDEYAAAAPTGCALPANPNPQAPSMRAITAALVDWVVSDKPPPASRYPTLAQGDLVEPTRKRIGFAAIPGLPAPEGKLNPFVLHDFGAGFRAEDLSGQMSVLPPRSLRVAKSLVPRVDADGNETVGVRSVQLRVPLGTYLGWNEQATGYYRGQGCGFNGSFIPFARTAAQRIASKDPRQSLQERYGDHAGFVRRVAAAVKELQGEGFLREEDARRIVADADASNVLVGILP